MKEREEERGVFIYIKGVDYYKFAIESKRNEIHVWAKESQTQSCDPRPGGKHESRVRQKRQKLIMT